MPVGLPKVALPVNGGLVGVAAPNTMVELVGTVIMGEVMVVTSKHSSVVSSELAQ